MRTIDLAPLPLSDLESHLDEVAVRRLRGGVDAKAAGRARIPPKISVP